MSVMTIRLDQAMQKELDRESKKLHVTRSQVVRQAIEDYLRRREDKRFMAALVRAAKATGPDENRRYAEEGLEWGDSGLSVAEGPAPLAQGRPARKKGRA